MAASGGNGVPYYYGTTLDDSANMRAGTFVNKQQSPEIAPNPVKSPTAR